MAVSLEDVGQKMRDPNARDLAESLSEATGKLLDQNKSPSRKCGEATGARPDPRACPPWRPTGRTSERANEHS